MSKNLETLAKYEFVPPIVKAENIQNPQTKEIALMLIASGQTQVQRSMQPYKLPESPAPEDPRSLIRIAYDKVLCAIVPRSTTAKIQRRIKEEKIMADAEAQYEWINASLKTISPAMTTMHNSYKNIADYVNTIRSGIERAEERTSSGRQQIKHNLEEIAHLEDDAASGELASEIENLLGSEAAGQAKTLLKNEANNLKKNIAQTTRENEYIDHLVNYYSRLLPASESSLKDIEEALKTAQAQQLDLQLTLHTYEGLTKNQIDATRAMQFLQDVQAIHRNLKSKMREVDELAFEQKERLALSSPTEITLPTASPEILQLREELRQK